MTTQPPAYDEHTALSQVSEEELLCLIVPIMRSDDERVILGPGDDAAVMAAVDGRFVVTTDAMARGTDWRDDWSSGEDVGRKAVAQNLADVAAMGAVPAGLVVTLLADPATSVAWAVALAEGIAHAAGAAGCPVLGGDLGGLPGAVVVSLTAFGDLQGRPPVTRAGARVGDVVAVAGTLGRSGAGLELLTGGRDREAAGDGTAAQTARDVLTAHRAPVAPYAAGPAAALAGARAMIDVSDGLVRDAGRMAVASGASLALESALLAPDIEAVARVLDPQDALRCVLTGGEEHSLLATFPTESGLPAPFRPIGRVVPALPDTPVTLDGCALARGGGWDHFAG